MSVLVDKRTRVVVQGITGNEATFHTNQMLEYGTKVVAGVTPGKGGLKYKGSEKIKFSQAIPVYNTIQEAIKETRANTSIIFVPAAFAGDAIMEAVDAGICLIVVITEGIPVGDMILACGYAAKKNVRIVGPNCPGIISPGKAKVGIMPGEIHKPGRVGIVSRSGTLTYEAVSQLSAREIGQSTCIGIGGDQMCGTSLVEIIKLLNDDKGTDAIVIIGEIGGLAEEEAADYIKKYVKKPVVCYIAGLTADPEKRMGHAGAIIYGGKGTAEQKILAMRRAGVIVADSSAVIGETMEKVLKKRKLSKLKTRKLTKKKNPKKPIKKK